MAPFNKTRVEKRQQLVRDIAATNDAIEAAQEKIASMSNELAELDKLHWGITDDGRWKAYESLFRVNGMDSPFFTTRDGTCARYDKLVLERTEGGLRVRFAHRGEEYIYVDVPGMVLDKMGSTLSIEGVSGAIEVKYGHE